MDVASVKKIPRTKPPRGRGGCIMNCGYCGYCGGGGIDGNPRENPGGRLMGGGLPDGTAPGGTAPGEIELGGTAPGGTDPGGENAPRGSIGPCPGGGSGIMQRLPFCTDHSR